MKIEKIHKKFSPYLKPLALPYACILRQRRKLYESGILKSYQAKAPTISIGNIAVGGTGKTPFTSCLIEWAESKKLEVIVLSRGYGGKVGKKPLIVQKDTSPSLCGDEPLFLKRKHPKAQIIVHPKRSLSAQVAEESFSPELILLDDGMQHLAMGRDLNIVLLREADLKDAWNRVIPHGLWREDKSALKSANALAMKISDEKLTKILPEIQKKLSPYKVPFFPFILEATGIRPIKKADKISFQSDYILLTGIGEPSQAETSTSILMGKKPIKHLIFSDHHAYSLEDVKYALSFKLPIICTEKDAVKLEKLLPSEAPFYAIDVQVKFGQSLFTHYDFYAWWEKEWESLRTCASSNP